MNKERVQEAWKSFCLECSQSYWEEAQQRGVDEDECVVIHVGGDDRIVFNVDGTVVTYRAAVDIVCEVWREWARYKTILEEEENA